MRFFSLALFLFLTACDARYSLGSKTVKKSKAGWNFSVSRDQEKLIIDIRGPKIITEEDAVYAVRNNDIFDGIFEDLLCEKENQLTKVTELPENSKYDFRVTCSCPDKEQMGKL
ncbi:hypothetical protein [uncultured Pseudoteredinibacter sp.]|uniref:hypothetical protein n=1 Tax=uncultured Pseudoteredinibacter sp. TaxID=1641701 RepID=UPI00260EB220|nr:hypothetical protein [uncultured Pseudoteredinibacter sp.]